MASNQNHTLRVVKEGKTCSVCLAQGIAGNGFKLLNNNQVKSLGASASLVPSWGCLGICPQAHLVVIDGRPQ